MIWARTTAGLPQLTVQGPAGATVKMIPGELLEADGLVRQTQSGAPVWFAYTLKGGGPRGLAPAILVLRLSLRASRRGVPEETPNAPAELPASST